MSRSCLRPHRHPVTVIDTSVRPHQRVWNLTMSFVAARAIHLIAETGVADQIADQPVPATALAARCGIDDGALDRVLALLSSHGVFERTDRGYIHTPASQLLRTDEPNSLRAFARMIGLPVFWSSVGSLDHSLRTGIPAIEHVTSCDLWTHLQTHPAQAALFGDAMAAKAR